MAIIRYKKKFKKKSFFSVKNFFLGLCQLGSYGIKALSSGLLTIKQVETSRRIIVNITERTGKVFIRVRFQHPITAKSLGSRMGKGSGSIKGYIFYIKKGTIFIELVGLSEKIVLKAFKGL